MYVCSCNGLTTRQVAGAVAAGADRPRDVYAACGCKAECGCCTATILSIIRETASQPAR